MRLDSTVSIRCTDEQKILYQKLNRTIRVSTLFGDFLDFMEARVRSEFNKTRLVDEFDDDYEVLK